MDAVSIATIAVAAVFVALVVVIGTLVVILNICMLTFRCKVSYNIALISVSSKDSKCLGSPAYDDLLRLVDYRALYSYGSI